MTETINLLGVDFDVEFDYQPEERPDRFYSGCPAEVESINEFTHQGTCFLDFVDDYEQRIKDLIFEKINDV